MTTSPLSTSPFLYVDILPSRQKPGSTQKLRPVDKLPTEPIQLPSSIPRVPCIQSNDPWDQPTEEWDSLAALVNGLAVREFRHLSGNVLCFLSEKAHNELNALENKLSPSQKETSQDILAAHRAISLPVEEYYHIEAKIPSKRRRRCTSLIDCANMRYKRWIIQIHIYWISLLKSHFPDIQKPPKEFYKQAPEHPCRNRVTKHIYKLLQGKAPTTVPFDSRYLA